MPRPLPQSPSLAHVANGGHGATLLPDLVLLAVTLLAALGWMFSYHALQGLPPLLFIGVRFLCAGLILAAVGYRATAALLKDGPLLRQCAAIGLILAIAMICWILGLRYTTALGAGAFISSLGVIIAPLLAGLLFGAHIGRPTWLAAAVATLGMACLALREGTVLHGADVFFLASAIAVSVQFTLNSRLAGKHVPVLPLSAIQLIITGLVALACSTLTESWPSHVSGETWSWLIASTVLGTSLRFYLQIAGQSRTPLSHAAFIMTLEPVWTTALAMLWLGERMRPLQLAGSLLILAALLISRWRAIAQ